MLYTAIMALLAAFVAKWSNNLLGQALTERPLVAGLIAGLFLGDVQTGVLVGAALEAVFLGIVDVGGSVTAEPVTATVLAVAFVSTMGMEQGTAVALAVPIGLLGGLVYSVIHLSISSLAAPLIEKAAATGDPKKVNLVWFVGGGIKHFIVAVPTFLGVLLGAEPMSVVMNQIPDQVIAGLTASGSLLPAVGMAMLMKMLWDNKIAIYWFLGFILVAYMGLGTVGVAAFGAVIVTLVVMNDLDAMKKEKASIAAGTVAADEEEDFFA